MKSSNAVCQLLEYLGMVSSGDPVLCLCDCIEVGRDLIYKLPAHVDLRTPMATHHLENKMRWLMIHIVKLCINE